MKPYENILLQNGTLFLFRVQKNISITSCVIILQLQAEEEGWSIGMMERPRSTVRPDYRKLSDVVLPRAKRSDCGSKIYAVSIVERQPKYLI